MFCRKRESEYWITWKLRAYDEGGTIYEGKEHYPSMEVAFQDLEAGIKAYLDK